MILLIRDVHLNARTVGRVRSGQDFFVNYEGSGWIKSKILETVFVCFKKLACF